MDIKFHSGGQWAQKKEINRDLEAKIKKVRESNYLNKTAQDEQIAMLRKTYQHKVNELTRNLY